MLSNLIISKNNKFVLIVDNIGYEKYSENILKNFLHEQGINSASILMLSNQNGSDSIRNEANKSGTTNEINVIIPSLMKFLISEQKTSVIFQFIADLKRNPRIAQIFLWVSTKIIPESFIISFLEYMADSIVTIKDLENLSILTRKSGGLVTNKCYLYKAKKDQFSIELPKQNKILEMPTIKPETLGTFKIDLEEEELVARNALKLPYERQEESKIIYTPDSDDDFDEDDPDEDLDI